MSPVSQPSVDAQRKAMICKIHVAKAQMRMGDDDYRSFLERVTGKTSSSLLSLAQLKRVLEELKDMGFRAKPARKAGGRPQADGPQAKKIRALWITLHQMGQVSDPSEQALARFAEKMSGVSDLKWMWSKDADKVIKALRGWIERCGGDPDEY